MTMKDELRVKAVAFTSGARAMLVALKDAGMVDEGIDPATSEGPAEMIAAGWLAYCNPRLRPSQGDSISEEMLNEQLDALTEGLVAQFLGEVVGGDPEAITELLKQARERGRE